MYGSPPCGFVYWACLLPSSLSILPLSTLSSLHHLPLGLWTPYHTSVALLPLPIFTLGPSFPPSILSSIHCVHSVAPCSTRPFSDRGLVCSNPVVSFIMVSDPMDAPYGTDTECVIKSRCPLFRRRCRGL